MQIAFPALFGRDGHLSSGIGGLPGIRSSCRKVTSVGWNMYSGAAGGGRKSKTVLASRRAWVSCRDFSSDGILQVQTN